MSDDPSFKKTPSLMTMFRNALYRYEVIEADIDLCGHDYDMLKQVVERSNGKTAPNSYIPAPVMVSNFDVDIIEPDHMKKSLLDIDSVWITLPYEKSASFVVTEEKTIAVSFYYLINTSILKNIF